MVGGDSTEKLDEAVFEINKRVLTKNVVSHRPKHSGISYSEGVRQGTNSKSSISTGIALTHNTSR